MVNMPGFNDGDDDLDVFVDEDDDDILILDEFDNDDTEDVSLSETLDAEIKVKPSEDKKVRYYPVGWSYKRKSRKLISPSGEVFSSRRAALKAMVNSEEYSMGEIEEMRSSLRHERWRESEDLPRCWMIRDGSFGPEILGAGGEFFKTLTEAAKFVEQYEEYFYQEDLRNFWIFVKNATDKNKKVRETSNNSVKKWKTDPLIPAGWKIKKRSGYQGANLYLLRTSNGKILIGKRPALKYMVKENYPDRDIENIRESLKTDGYITLESLPPNWLYKQMKAKAYFIDPIGNVFDSIEIVTKKLKSSLNFDLNQFIESVSKTSSTETQNKWIKDDKSVPKGWMTKEYTIGKIKFKKLFSPNDQIFQSRRMALKFMIENQYPVDQIEEMRRHLKHDNWHPDPALPEKWLYQKNKRGGYCFINQNGHYFKNKSDIVASLDKNVDLSFIDNFLKSKKGIGIANNRCSTQVIKYLRQKGRYDDVEKVNEFILRNGRNAVLKKRKEIKTEKWMDLKEECLKGWKLMIYASGSKHYKTPSGEVLRNKPQILTFLKTKNVAEETVCAMMEGISKIAYKRKRDSFRSKKLKART